MSECIKPLIQEFVDGELSPPERQRVTSHCAACRDCGRELDEQQHISRAVRGLGIKPLPVGFFQRLDRKRKEAPVREPRRALLTGPARAAAFAFSAAIVVMVARDRMNQMFPVKVASASAPDLTLVDPAASKPQRADAFQPSIKLAKAKGTALGEEFAAAKALRKEAAPEPRPAPAAPAAVMADAGQVTNESIQAALEAEKKREHITILPRQADTEREVTQMLAGIDPSLAAQMRAPAPINGPTPVGLAGGGGAGRRMSGLSAVASVRGAAAENAAEAKAEQTAGASGLILNSDAERAAIWASRGLKATAPKVNYEKSRMLLVIANDYKTVVEIAGLVEGADRVLVTYRLSELPEGATRRTDAPSYQYRVAPRSDKPVQFQRLP